MNAQLNLSVQTMQKDTWQEVRTVKWKKSSIRKTQADGRVGTRRALQILAEDNESPKSNPPSYPTHFR